MSNIEAAPKKVFDKFLGREIEIRSGFVMTVFGPAIIHGPFADDYTSLKWVYEEHWSGEIARFKAAGLYLYVKDYDGDRSGWVMKDLKSGAILAEGEDGGFDPPNFWKCLADAEAALRTEVARRKAALLQ